MNWWESAPLANAPAGSSSPLKSIEFPRANQAPAPQQQGNWWEAAPLVSAAPDPSTSFGMEMGDQILSLGGAVPSAAPALAGALNYVQEGGAEGSYGRGREANIARHEQSQVANPRAALLGDVAAAVIPVPGVAAAAAPRLAARAVEGALRWGGRAGQGLTAYSVLNKLSRGEMPSFGDVISFAAGKGSGKLANVMREGRLAKKVATEAAPRAGTLSDEMKAALKREKFRHDYSTGEWADLLEAGGVSKYRGGH